MEYSFGKVSYATVRSSWSVLHAEVQVEPVGQLDLEANSDSIVPFLTGNVQDEPAAEIIQNAGGDLHSFCFHVGARHPTSVSEQRSTKAIRVANYSIIFILRSHSNSIDPHLYTNYGRAVYINYKLAELLRI